MDGWRVADWMCGHEMVPQIDKSAYLSSSAWRFLLLSSLSIDGLRKENYNFFAPFFLFHASNHWPCTCSNYNSFMLICSQPLHCKRETFHHSLSSGHRSILLRINLECSCAPVLVNYDTHASIGVSPCSAKTMMRRILLPSMLLVSQRLQLDGDRISFLSIKYFLALRHPHTCFVCTAAAVDLYTRPSHENNNGVVAYYLSVCLHRCCSSPSVYRVHFHSSIIK